MFWLCKRCVLTRHTVATADGIIERRPDQILNDAGVFLLYKKNIIDQIAQYLEYIISGYESDISLHFPTLIIIGTDCFEAKKSR